MGRTSGVKEQAARLLLFISDCGGGSWTSFDCSRRAGPSREGVQLPVECSQCRFHSMCVHRPGGVVQRHFKRA
jgi:hypothetical protein